MPIPPVTQSTIEPGLEEAVNWKWSVAPAEKLDWGMPLPEAVVPEAGGPANGITPASPGELRPDTYEVIKGDALVKIANKFDMSVAQLKQFNDLKGDRIIIGQSLRIPTAADLLAMAPPPPPPAPPPNPKPASGKKHKDAAKNPEIPALLAPTTMEELGLQTVLLQVFLDREMFSLGAIDGELGPGFRKITQIYQQSHPAAADDALLKAKAFEEVKQPYTTYVLRAEDFKFIKPRKDEPMPIRATYPPPGKNKEKGEKPIQPAPSAPPVTWQEVAAADFLAYTSAWEFVAERFHCNEAFLRRINARIKGSPAAEMIFQVPNVVPFEIEKAFEPPLQPEADPEHAVTAAVVELSRLEITRAGQLIAVLPLASARPGLHGRGSWTILDVVSRPRMASKHEPRESPKAPPAPVAGIPPAAVPEVAPPLETPQFLASGPNNPVGILWINLAKAKSTEPLPYGLHGTSIPGQMNLQGIGGFRLANWDIARVVGLMPAGTALQWKVP